MNGGHFAAILGAIVVLAASPLQADNAGRLEPLDGMQSLTGPASEPGIRSERSPLLAVPQGELSPRATTPFGTPLPPNQLTPAPVLPFNPNRSLMPPSSTPAPSSGGGRLGR